VIYIDYNKISEIASLLRSIKIKVDKFTNPNFFPPENYNDEEIARFFFFIVAIDHRTGTYDDPFEGYVDGMFLRGSDLLYHLAVKKFLEKTDYFSPKHLIKITAKDIANWFSIDKPRKKIISDAAIRAILIRDLAKKLVKIYDGKVTNIISISDGYLYRRNGNGFIDQLKTFIAYSDPVEKKPFLLTKFLERRGLIVIRDKENINVPVDNHLMRIAIRLGLVKPLENKIKYFTSWDNKVDRDLDTLFRLVAKRAYKLLANKTQVSPFLLDDFFWVLGRERCRFNEPLCDKVDSENLIDDCPLKKSCEQYSLRKRIIFNEHRFLKTWYY